jgi:hypothetical protein
LAFAVLLKNARLIVRPLCVPRRLETLLLLCLRHTYHPDNNGNVKNTAATIAASEVNPNATPDGVVSDSCIASAASTPKKNPIMIDSFIVALLCFKALIVNLQLLAAAFTQ